MRNKDEEKVINKKFAFKNRLFLLSSLHKVGLRNDYGEERTTFVRVVFS